VKPQKTKPNVKKNAGKKQDNTLNSIMETSPMKKDVGKKDDNTWNNAGKKKRTAVVNCRNARNNDRKNVTATADQKAKLVADAENKSPSTFLFFETQQKNAISSE
jgi:hypothetical protein